MLRSIVLALALACAVPAIAQDYKVDGVHTSILFNIRHFNIGRFYGVVYGASGDIKWDAANPDACKIAVSAPADRVVTGNQKRDDHVKSPSFLDVKQFATIGFESTKIAKKDGNMFDVTGKLTLHGVTKEVSFTFELLGTGKDPHGNERIGGETSFKIKRSDFGMTEMLESLGDEVGLTISIEGVVKKSE